MVTEGPGTSSASDVISTFNPSWRAVQLVYLVFGIIDGLLLIRLVLKLLGANPAAAFSSWEYNLTDIFLAPFKSILPTITSGQSQLEMGVLVAMLVYGLLGWAVARLVTILFYRNVTVAHHSRGLRPKAD
ncbi:MAG TPA: YggT family protein [Candidatus Dormibacteraeota bacterium]|nr:YggT family protein [Candidatus Dormibacteraeota bacterium]